VQCIGEAFGVNLEDPEQQALYSMKSASLLSIFEVFLRTQKRIRESSSAPSSAASEDKKPEVSEDDIKKAEELKATGNRKVSDRNYPEAIKFYSEAIKLNPNNAVYYANRAAAYSQQGDHEKAVEDSWKAAEVDPNYSKAYSRAGHAYFSLGKYQEAVDAYEKGLSLDPQNATMKSSLATARVKLEEQTVDVSQDAEGTGGGLPGGLPGGMDIASLLSNPAIMGMAQQMMQSGALDQIMSNPNMAQMAQNMMNNSGGGTPNVSEMLRNPEMMEMARNLMGNMGGAGGNPPLDEHDDA